MCDQDHFEKDRQEFEANGLVTRKQFGVMVGAGVAMMLPRVVNAVAPNMLHTRVADVVARMGPPPWSVRLIQDERNLVTLIANGPGTGNRPLTHPVRHRGTHSFCQPQSHHVTVTNGVVDLWGVSSSDVERRAIRVAAERVPGVSAVNDHLITRQLQAWY